MQQEFDKYPDDILVKMAESSDNEEWPMALFTLATRKHSKVSDICLLQINRNIAVERNIISTGDTSDALDTWYFFDKNKAISFFKSHINDLPLDAFGSFISNYTDVYYKEEEIDSDLVQVIKSKLNDLTETDIEKIKDDFEDFSKAFG